MLGVFHRSIGARLAGLIVLMLVLIGIGAGVSVAGLGEMRAVATRLATSGDDLNSVSKIALLLSESRAQVMLTLQHDPSGQWVKYHDHPADRHLDLIANQRNELAKNLEAYMARSHADEERQLIERLAEATKRYVDEGLMPAHTAAKAGRFEETNAILLKQLNPAHAAAMALVTEAENRIVAESHAAEASAVATSVRSRTTTIGAALLTLLLGGIIGGVVARSITRPLGSLQDVIVRVEQTGDCTLRVGATGQDEAGRTAAAFDTMLSKIATLIGSTRQSADAIANAAQSMAATGAKVEKSSGEQAEAASAAAAAIEQTSVSISETARNASAADETATRARGQIETTLTAVHETAGHVDILAGMINEASGDIGRLAESSRQIDGIVQTIKDIADQTNLLALNAAIEAARAGEQGRGFAVVADEVRKLAENTGKSTSEISRLIGGIQAEVDAAVSRMSAANEKAGATRDHIVASAKSLDAVSADTGLVNDSVRSISDAVREQDIAVNQVARRMEQIAQMTEQNTASSRSAADAARQLDALAGKLRESVGRFKV